MKNGTKTSSFGVSARANHDASKFYNSNLYKNLNKKRNVIFKETFLSENKLDKIFCSSSEKMKELPNNSVHLMITSPPYNVGKDYDINLSLKQYLALLRRVLKETYRVLSTGGRVAINVANIGRKPYIPLHSHIIDMMLELGFLMRGEIIWNKSASSGTSFAWGSWKSASNPVLRDVHEYILIFSKDSYSRKKDIPHISLPLLRIPKSNAPPPSMQAFLIGISLSSSTPFCFMRYQKACSNISPVFEALA